MSNLNAKKGNIKKLVIVLGVGGIVTLTTLTGVMHPEKIQQIPEQVQEIVTGTKPVHKLGLSNEEFVERFAKAVDFPVRYQSGIYITVNTFRSGTIPMIQKTGRQGKNRKLTGHYLQINTGFYSRNLL